MVVFGSTRLNRFLVAALTLLLLAGCGGGEEPAMEEEEPTAEPTYGSVLVTALHEDPPPQRTKIDASGNPECQVETILGEKVVVNDSGTLRDVFAQGPAPAHSRDRRGISADHAQVRRARKT